MAITQLVLASTLLGLLLAWMVTFALLAIRPDARQHVMPEDLPTPSHSLSAISAPTLLHVIVSQPLQPHAGTVSSEPPSDLGATSVI